MALTAKKVYAILKRQISDMEAKLNSPVRYRGTVATADLLPLNPDIGDMYNIESKSVYGEAGMNVAWNGVVWDTMGAPIDMSLYFTKEEAEAVIQRLVTEYFEKNPVKPGATTEQAQQIEQNKTDIASLKVGLGDIESQFEIKTEAFVNKCSIIRNNTPNNFIGNQITGVKQYFDFGKNATLTKIKMNIKASNDDTVVLEIATLDGNIIATAEKAVTTEYTDVVFDLENVAIKEPVSVFVYTKGTNLLSYGLYGTPYDDPSFSYIFPDGTRKSAFKIDALKIPEPTTSNNQQCLVLFFDYTSKIIKNIHDFISQNIDTTLLKSGKSADAKVVGDKFKEAKAETDSLKEDLDNKITKFYASNQGEAHITDSDNGKIHDMVLYGKSEQNQYKGINLLPTSISYNEIIEASIPKGTHIFWATDGTPALGGNFKFYNEDKTQETWFGVDAGKTAMTSTIDIDVKYIKFLISKDQSVKICLGIGDDPVYEPYTGGQPSPSPDYPQEIKSVVNPTVKVSSEDKTEFQTVTLPYTLNAIPVHSGGNVTIDGQQYIADYVDVEHGKVIRNILKWRLGDLKYGFNNAVWHMNISGLGIDGSKIGLSNMFKIQNGHYNGVTTSELYIAYDGKTAALNMRGMTDEEFKKWLREKNPEVYNVLTVAEEIPITLEEVSAFKQLMTYYPVTNVSVNSEQLDGYTVFNYPISMKNGWNYVKKQLNDNRDYIYDMDSRTQDIDTQSAEAYVNSEYAVALTELEV
jgi:hypothetical protein